MAGEGRGPILQHLLGAGGWRGLLLRADTLNSSQQDHEHLTLRIMRPLSLSRSMKPFVSRIACIRLLGVLILHVTDVRGDGYCDDQNAYEHLTER
jgi:hypothetical protein